MTTISLQKHATGDGSLWHQEPSLMAIGNSRLIASAVTQKNPRLLPCAMKVGDFMAITELSSAIGVTGIWAAIPIGWVLADVTGLIYMKFLWSKKGS